MLSTVLLYASPVLACVAIAFSLVAISNTKKKSVRSISLRKIIVMDEKVDDLDASVASLSKQVRNIRSRLNMASKRAAEKKPDPDAEPDSKLNPQAWKDWARNKHLRR